MPTTFPRSWRPRRRSWQRSSDRSAMRTVSSRLVSWPSRLRRARVAVSTRAAAMTDRAEERPSPLHLAVLVGASAGIYAISLGTVTALQSATDQAVIDARAPLDQAIRDLAATNDGFATRLYRAAHADDTLSSAYDRVGPLL